MRIHDALGAIVESPVPEQYETFRRYIDPIWIEEALAATGTATIRRRRLPAEQVIWLVLGMALLRDRSIVEVANKLDLALPGQRPTAAPSSIRQARARLGAEPMEWLFVRTATEWAHQSAGRYRWRGLALYGVDGSMMRVADSSENRTYFGACKGPGGVASAYPQVRLVVLMGLRSHLLAHACLGPAAVSEIALARQLWHAVPDHSLTILDRGLHAAHILLPLFRDGQNRHWLTRLKKNARWTVVKKFGVNDLLVERPVSPESRQQDPSLPTKMIVRVIRYHRRGFRLQTLMTSLLDPIAYPAQEIIALYHERWELELAYDEIKTEMLAQEPTLRSQQPEGVQQELWGILLLYNLIRLEMERIADQAKVLPTRISFVVALRLIYDEWLWCAMASPGAIPVHLARLRQTLILFILPPRRQRNYPRVVKLKSTNYVQKRRRSP